MGARGCALDNAVSEAFFASLKMRSSTAAPGRPAKPPATPRSRGSKAGTTAGVCTARSATSRPADSLGVLADVQRGEWSLSAYADELARLRWACVEGRGFPTTEEPVP